MTRVQSLLILTLLAVVAETSGTGAQTPAPAPAGPVSFTRQIRPILDLRCLECHDDSERESGLSMMSVASLIAGGDEAGAAIVPGKPDESPILGSSPVCESRACPRTTGGSAISRLP